VKKTKVLKKKVLMREKIPMWNIKKNQNRKEKTKVFLRMDIRRSLVIRSVKTVQ
jgi:hypothetical protein